MNKEIIEKLKQAKELIHKGMTDAERVLARTYLDRIIEMLKEEK